MHFYIIGSSLQLRGGACLYIRIHFSYQTTPSLPSRLETSPSRFDPHRDLYPPYLVKDHCMVALDAAVEIAKPALRVEIRAMGERVMAFKQREQSL